MSTTDQKLRAILFDLDGTLLDSYPIHYRANKLMLAHYGIELTPELFGSVYSPNWLAMYAALGLSEETWEEADAYWLDEVRKHEPPLFPDTRPLLESLQDRYLLGLVTSGSRERVSRDLAAAGIGDLFQVVVTGDDISERKPHPEGLIIALERLQIAPDEALYVGDAWEDCRMAQAADVHFVGVAREFATVSDVGNCDQLAGLGELEPYIERLLGD